MSARKYGRIVTVTSDARRVGEPHIVVYSGAKAAGRSGITAECVALDWRAGGRGWRTGLPGVLPPRR